MDKLQLKIIYEELVKEKLKNESDISRMNENYNSFASFYPELKNHSDIIDLLKNIDISNCSLDNMLNSSNVGMNVQVMNNGETRCRITDDATKFSYVAVDTKDKKKGGSPHQNSHEHYYTIEVSRVESGFVIAAELLKNNNVKLVRYNPGQYWASVPGIVHNISFMDGSRAVTLKTPSPIPDWYGTGNVINSELSYFVDSRTKTMDLDQMNYVINHNDGIVDDQVVSEFKLDRKWNDLLSKYIRNPYEVLITPDNREDFRQLLLITKDNNLAAFYAHLTNKDIKAAVKMASMFGENTEAALDFITKNGTYDISVASDFKKILKLKR